MATELFILAGKEEQFNRKNKKWVAVATLYYTKGSYCFIEAGKNHSFIMSSWTCCQDWPRKFSWRIAARGKA